MVNIKEIIRIRIHFCALSAGKEGSLLLNPNCRCLMFLDAIRRRSQVADDGKYDSLQADLNANIGCHVVVYDFVRSIVHEFSEMFKRVIFSKTVSQRVLYWGED
jgi:hypothetical protein